MVMAWVQPNGRTAGESTVRATYRIVGSMVSMRNVRWKRIVGTT